jgi:hypothetical protein
MKPHVAPSHVDVAFARAAHGVHDEPQLFTELFCTQTPPHR